MQDRSKEDVERENAELKKRLWLNQAHWETDKMSLECSRMEIGCLTAKVIQLEIYICKIRDMYAEQLDFMQRSHPDWKDTEGEGLLSKNFDERIDVWFAEMYFTNEKQKEKIKEFRDARCKELDRRHRERMPEITKNEKENSPENKSQ